MMYTFPTQEHAYSYHKKKKLYTRDIKIYDVNLCIPVACLISAHGYM